MSNICIRSIRDYIFFEELSSIDNGVLCEKNRCIDVPREEFEPRNIKVNEEMLNCNSCLEYTNYEKLYGNTICSKNHTLGVACDCFIDVYLKERLN